MGNLNINWKKAAAAGLLSSFLLTAHQMPLSAQAADSGSQLGDVISNQLELQFNIKSSSSKHHDSDHSNSAPTSNTEQITVAVETGELGKGSDISTAVINRITEANGKKRDEVTFGADKAKETVQKAKESGQTTARIVIPDTNDEVSQVDVSIPLASANELAAGGLSLEIYTENARIILPNDSLNGLQDDFYFRFVPIKEKADQQVVEERARVEKIVKEAAGDNSIEVVGRPMTIETNLSSRAVGLVLPLPNDVLPADEAERQAFLADLVIFIEHSDGDRELVKPEVVDYKNGQQGLKFGVTKFSTFTVLNMEGWEEYFKEQQAKNAQAANEHKAYVEGYPDHTFKPDNPISRAEMAALLSRIEAGTRGSEKPAAFADLTAEHWAKSAVEYVNTAGLMEGYADGTFGLERSMTRAEMAEIVSRWFKLDGVAEDAFTDTKGHWAEKSISLAAQAGIIEGMPDGSFQPDQTLTRAEAVTMMNRILKRGPLLDAAPVWSDVQSTYWAFGQIEEASLDHHFVKDTDGSEHIQP